jgi:hypothetical protein
VQYAWGIFSSVACSVVQYHIFPHDFIKERIFEKKNWAIKDMFWFYLQRISETCLILRRKERDIIKNVYWSSCKVSVFPGRFGLTSNMLNMI